MKRAKKVQVIEVSHYADGVIQLRAHPTMLLLRTSAIINFI